MDFDTLGPLNPTSIDGFRYVLMIVNEISQLKVVKCLRPKIEALEMFQEFIAEHRFPIFPRSDIGKEFMCESFRRFPIEIKTKQHEFTVPETPEQIGLAERANKTTVEKQKLCYFQRSYLKHVG